MRGRGMRDEGRGRVREGVERVRVRGRGWGA